MTISWPTIEAQENHEWLLDRYARLLLRQEPVSVLDVGCGKGGLLKVLAELGVCAIGLDQAGPRLEELRTEGRDVREGSAYELPFEDQSVGWASLRHVPHHLEEPARAFAELVRVARRGVILAEPYFDVTLPSQRGALLLDRWQKRQHRRRGMFHAEDLSLGELLGLMPEGFEEEFDVQVEQHLRPRARSVEAFVVEARALLDDLPAGHEECGALDALVEELGKIGLSWNGSLCLVLRRG